MTPDQVSEGLENLSSTQTVNLYLKAGFYQWPFLADRGHGTDREKLRILYAARSLLVSSVSIQFPKDEDQHACFKASSKLSGFSYNPTASSDFWATSPSVEYAKEKEKRYDVFRLETGKNIAACTDIRPKSRRLLSCADLSIVKTLKAEVKSYGGIDLYRGFSELLFPEKHFAAWTRFNDVSDSDPDWLFWREWYQNFIDGVPPDWELLREVAEFPEDVWDMGHSLIARRIEQSQARLAVRRLCDSLEQILLPQNRPKSLIGHNNPPEPMMAALEINFETLLLVVRKIQTEAENPRPDSKKVAKLYKELSKIFMTLGGWLANKLDKSAEEFFKSLGKLAGVTAGGTTAIYIFDLLKLLDPLLQVVKSWFNLI